jgi:MoaA/NifB/PqqE/SkfB family radical SAM enzyme
VTDVTNDRNYNVTAYYDNGDSVNVYASKLFYLGLTEFQGWECHAGVSRICIEPNGAVYSAECKNDYLGNLYTGDFELLKTPNLCKLPNCDNNPDDVMIRKNLIIKDTQDKS